MSELEAGNTPSCSISQSDERRLQRLGLENNGVSGVFTRGLKALEDIEELKSLKKDLENGQGNMAELLKEIEEL